LFQTGPGTTPYTFLEGKLPESNLNTVHGDIPEYNDIRNRNQKKNIQFPIGGSVFHYVSAP